jgi:hypothetical protein
VQNAWRIVAKPAPLTATPFKFPSLMMLPLMALGSDGGRPMLRVQTRSGETVLSLYDLSRSVSAELRQQIRGRLHALYGERFRFECHLPTPHQLKITLQPTPTLPGESHA